MDDEFNPLLFLLAAMCGMMLGDLLAILIGVTTGVWL